MVQKGILICNGIYVSLATKRLFWRDADKPSICNCKEVFICLFQLTLCCSNVACKSLIFLSRKSHSYKTRDDCFTTTFNMNRISQELEVWWRNATGNWQLFYQEGLCRVKSWKNAWRKDKWEKQVSYQTWSVQSITWNCPRFCGCLLWSICNVSSRIQRRQIQKQRLPRIRQSRSIAWRLGFDKFS